jgi:hypothetical protein
VAIVRIQDLALLLAVATGGAYKLHDLATKFFLLSDSPTWVEVQSAIEGYSRGRLKQKQDQSSHESVIDKYHEMLLEYSELLRGGLYLAWLIGRKEISDQKNGTEPLKVGLQAGLGLQNTQLRSTRTELIQKQLESLFSENEQDSATSLLEHLSMTPSGDDIDAWLPPFRVLITSTTA